MIAERESKRGRRVSEVKTAEQAAVQEHPPSKKPTKTKTNLQAASSSKEAEAEAGRLNSI